MSIAANRLNFTRMRATIRPTPAADTSGLYVAKVIATATPGLELVENRLTDQGFDFTVWGFSISMGQSVVENILLAFSCETPGATIRYNESFAPPTMQSRPYTAPILLKTPGRYYFAAQAYKFGLRPSPVLRVQYDLTTRGP